jgi:hypothetical protein
MSATQPSRDPEPRPTVARAARDMGEGRERRRHASRRSRLARMDVGLGVLGAIVLILATPGLAISGLIALLVLGVCGVSFLIERRRRARARRAIAPAGSARGSARSRRGAPQRRRSLR